MTCAGETLNIEERLLILEEIPLWPYPRSMTGNNVELHNWGQFIVFANIRENSDLTPLIV